MTWKTAEQHVSTAAEDLYTGGRIVPGLTPQGTWREHHSRYHFAGAFVPGKVVLDIASGMGIGTRFLRDLGAKACLGLDNDLPSLRSAASRFAGCAFVACDAAKLCLKDASVDVVVSLETIEHLADPLGFLNECRRVLRPGGTFVCSTPARDVHRWEGVNPFHRREFHPTEFRELMEALFTDCQFYGQRHVVFPLFALRKIVRRLAVRFGLGEKLFTVWSDFRREGPPAKDEFDRDGGAGIVDEIRPYARRWWRRPKYVLAVGRRGPASPRSR